MDFLGRTVAALTGELLYQSPWGPGLPSVGARDVLVRCQAELGVFAEGLPTVTKGYGLPRRLIAHTVFSRRILPSAFCICVKATCTRLSPRSSVASASTRRGPGHSSSPRSPQPWSGVCPGGAHR